MLHSALEGRRVLIVEDELAIAMLVESTLEEAHCRIVGPYGSLREALAAARTETFDLAVLDVNLAGEMVFPVAEVLAERGVPFLVLSGYGDSALPPGRKHWPVCGKPFTLSDLMRRLDGLMQAS